VVDKIEYNFDENGFILLVKMENERDDLISEIKVFLNREKMEKDRCGK
jgi:hypothetical protein